MTRWCGGGADRSAKVAVKQITKFSKIKQGVDLKRGEMGPLKFRKKWPSEATQKA